MIASGLAGPPAVAQVLAPGLVLLGQQGIALVSAALTVAAQRAARDGISLPPAARELLAALADASGFGSVGSSFEVAGASFGQDAVDVQEVARVLEVSDRRARQLCSAGEFETGRKVAGRWQVDRLELQGWRDDRRNARRSA